MPRKADSLFIFPHHQVRYHAWAARCLDWVLVEGQHDAAVVSCGYYTHHSTWLCAAWDMVQVDIAVEGSLHAFVALCCCESAVDVFDSPFAWTYSVLGVGASSWVHQGHLGASCTWQALRDLAEILGVSSGGHEVHHRERSFLLVEDYRQNEVER